MTTRFVVSILAAFLSVVSVHGGGVCTNKEVNIDFETCSNGESLFAGKKIDELLMFSGVRFAARRGRDKRRNANSPFDDGMIFDTRNPTGGDDDLGHHPELGLVFIISEDGDSSDPDDEGKGGEMIALFDTPSTLHKVTLLDMDKPGGTVVLYDINGSVLKRFNIPNMKDGDKTVLNLQDTGNVSKMVVNVKTSGAIDDVNFSACLMDPPSRHTVVTGGAFTRLPAPEQQRMINLMKARTPAAFGPWPECVGKTVEECQSIIVASGATDCAGNIKPATPRKFNFYRIWIQCDESGKVVGVPRRG